jgi:tol-pal system protein YbgF
MRRRFTVRESAWVLSLAAASAAVLLTGCASTPPEDDPVQIKLNEIDARLTRIERVVSNQSLVEMAQNLDAAQADIRKLRGRVDELENSMEAMRKQQRDLYSDLDKRVGGASANGGTTGAGGTAAAGGAAGGQPSPAAGAAGTAGTAGSASPPGPAPAGSSVEQAVYTQAFDALKAGSYSVAITGFKDFLASYPNSPLAENAQYWLGEAYYVTRDYPSAQDAFRTVLQKYPDSRKGADALVKLGFTQFELKHFVDARKTLEQVTQKYPDTDAARLAQDRLKRIPAGAH